jgi:hypothetical protein
MHKRKGRWLIWTSLRKEVSKKSITKKKKNRKTFSRQKYKNN